MQKRGQKSTPIEVLKPLPKAAALKRGPRAMRHQKSGGALLLQLLLLQQLIPPMPSATKWDWPMQKRDGERAANDALKAPPEAAALKRRLCIIRCHESVAVQQHAICTDCLSELYASTRAHRLRRAQITRDVHGQGSARGRGRRRHA